MHAVPEEPAILPPALRGAGLRIDFVEMTRLLARFDVPVPRIEAIDEDRRWLLLEDLGTTHLCDLAGKPLHDRLHEAAALLARVHAIPHSDELPFERAFDEEWVAFEVAYSLDHLASSPVPPDLREESRELVRRVAALPRVLCLRDYQSQNLMVDPSGRLRVLDYQDALLAPAELDLAAFLHDSYLLLDPQVHQDLLRTYESVRGTRVPPESLTLLVVQRKCKDLARFRHLVRDRGDTRFAPYEDRARQAVLRALAESRDLGEAFPALGRVVEAAGR
jgi:aminoglycoside/choline kinase family phosphotransferase